MTYTAHISFKASVGVDIRDRLMPIATLSCAPGVRRVTWVRLDAPLINKYMRSLEGRVFQASGLLNPVQLREARR